MKVDSNERSYSQKKSKVIVITSNHESKNDKRQDLILTKFRP